jgi:hypothetical protein
MFFVLSTKPVPVPTSLVGADALFDFFTLDGLLYI